MYIYTPSSNKKAILINKSQDTSSNPISLEYVDLFTLVSKTGSQNSAIVNKNVIQQGRLSVGKKQTLSVISPTVFFVAELAKLAANADSAKLISTAGYIVISTASYSNSDLKLNSDGQEHLTPIDQKGTGGCATIPLLHMIQNQMDFPIDFNTLWNCIPPSVPDAPELNDLSDNLLPSTKKFYNLLFSGQCYPVGSRVPDCPGGSVIDNDPCDPTCAEKWIKIIPVKKEGSEKPPIKDLCEQNKAFGPQALQLSATESIKLRIMEQFGVRYEDLPSDAETSTNADGDPWWYDYYPDPDVRDGLHKTIDSNIGHTVTIINCDCDDTNCTVTVNNSWGEDTASGGTLTLNIPSDRVLSDNTKQAKIINSYIIKVEICEDRPTYKTNDSCKEKQCKKLGYDGKKMYDPVMGGPKTCECICATITTSSGQQLQKTFNVSTRKCDCSNISIDDLCGEGNWKILPEFDPWISQSEYKGDCNCIPCDPCVDSDCTGECIGSGSGSGSGDTDVDQIYN